LLTCQPHRKKKKKQIGMNHTREGIGGSRQPAGQVEGEQQVGRWRSKGEKSWCTGEEPKQRHKKKPEQDGVRHVEWELYHQRRQVRQQQHGQKAVGGK
jgi:hypothetical protein